MSRASTKDKETVDIFIRAIENEVFSYEQLRTMLIKATTTMNTHTIEDILLSVSVDLTDIIP